jgi:hypothetical protein
VLATKHITKIITVAVFGNLCWTRTFFYFHCKKTIAVDDNYSNTVVVDNVPGTVAVGTVSKARDQTNELMLGRKMGGCPAGNTNGKGFIKNLSKQD